MILIAFCNGFPRLIYHEHAKELAWFNILEAARFKRVKFLLSNAPMSRKYLRHPIDSLPSVTAAQLLDLEVVPGFGQPEGLTAGQCLDQWRADHDLRALSLDIFATVPYPLCVLMVYSFGLLAIAIGKHGTALADPEDKRYWQWVSMTSSSNGSTSAPPITIRHNARETNVFHGSMFQELAEFISRTASPDVASQDEVRDEAICSLCVCVKMIAYMSVCVCVCLRTVDYLLCLLCGLNDCFGFAHTGQFLDALAAQLATVFLFAALH